MRIEKLVAVGCLRFSLNPDNHHLVFEPHDDIQIILGSNGSGKSTLMNYLLLVIPDKKDFEEDGSLDIFLEHHGQSYHLSYQFSSKEPYQFSVSDGQGGYKNINESYKVTTQRELIRQYFGLTPDIQSLLLGKERITSMVPSKRRQWFIQLSDANYDFAMSVYEELLKKHRDYKGAVKVAKERLVQERHATLSADEENALLIEQGKLRNDIQLLLQNEPMLSIDKQDTYDVMQRKLKDIDVIWESAPKLHPDVPSAIRDYNYLQAELVKLTTIISSSRVTHGEIQKQFLKLNGERKALLTHLAAKEEAQHIQELRQDVEGLTAAMHYTFVFDNSKMVLNSLELCKKDIFDCIGNLVVNDHNQYNQDDHRKHQQLIQENQGLVMRLEQRIRAAESELEMIARQKLEHLAQCPACEHRFVPGLAPHREEELKAAIADHEDAKIDLATSIAKSQEYLALVDDYLAKNRQFLESIKPLSTHPDIYKLLRDYPDRKIAPNGLIAVLNGIVDTVEKMVLRDSYLNKIAEHHAQEELSQQLSSMSIEHYDQQLVKLENQLEALNSRIFDCMERKMALTKFEEHYVIVVRNSDVSLAALMELKEKWRDYIAITKLEFIHQVRKQLQSELTAVDYKLMQHTMALKSIEVLHESLAEAQKYESHYKALVDALSPNKGLIGEGLTGHINDFIHNMNIIIKHIWTYPLVLNPVQMDEDFSGLDYYFSFRRGEDLREHGDVQESSEGMASIINLAFQIVAMKNLKLLEYPLVLDEFGANLDRAHRERSSDMITRVMEELPFPQLFMISHFASTYGAFVNAEKFVLHADNIDAT